LARDRVIGRRAHHQPEAGRLRLLRRTPTLLAIPMPSWL
jgi:hypothetical protein